MELNYYSLASNTGSTSAALIYLDRIIDSQLKPNVCSISLCDPKIVDNGSVSTLKFLK